MTGETDPFRPPINLAREADFRLGGLSVSPQTREAVRGELRESLEPRVMQVLVALFQAQGRVVSRDELIARCWEGRIVGEDAINRAIGRLRRLSEADAEASFSVETIPRVGYRLLAGPAAPDLPRSPSPPSPPRAGGGILHRHRLAIAGSILLAVAAIAAWLSWPQPRWTVESSRPFVSTLALEGEPAFSPDGKTLAYTSGPDPLSRNIHIRNVAGGNGLRLVSDGYDDTSPAWSPDGTRIAYVAVKPGEPCRIMVVAVPAGETRQVGRCAIAESASVSWQPGTAFLYFGDQAASSEEVGARESSAAVMLRMTDVIVRLDLDSGEKRVLAKDPASTVITLEHLQCSPDGRSLLFVGTESASTSVLRIRDLASGKEKVLGKIVIGGSAAWSEDSRSVLVAKANGIGSEIIAQPVDGAAPYPVYAAAINVSHLAAGKGGLLALETDPRRQNLARAVSGPAVGPDILDAANGKTWSPTFAPDGTLAFLSNRSGTNAVWVIRPGGTPALLYDGGLSPLFRLAFSPDGKYLAMPVAREDGLTIVILTADGATVSAFPSPTLGFGAPTWTPDSRQVIYFDKRALGYVSVDIANPARRNMAAPKLWGGVFYRAGHTYAARPFKPGYWQLDPQPRLVTAKYPAFWEPPPALLGDALLVPDFQAAAGPRILAQPLNGGPDRVLAHAPGAQAQPGILESGMAVNPKSGEIVYVAGVQSDTNIDLLTLAKR